MADLNNSDNLSAEKEEALKKQLLFLNDDLGKETVVELTEAYVESTDKILNNIDAAVKENNYIEIRNLAHSLRGNSGTFGFEALVSACKELEINISNDKLDDTTSLLEKITAELKEDVLLLQRLVNQ